MTSLNPEGASKPSPGKRPPKEGASPNTSFFREAGQVGRAESEAAAAAAGRFGRAAVLPYGEHPKRADAVAPARNRPFRPTPT